MYSCKLVHRLMLYFHPTFIVFTHILPSSLGEELLVEFRWNRCSFPYDRQFPSLVLEIVVSAYWWFSNGLGYLFFGVICTLFHMRMLQCIFYVNMETLQILQSCDFCPNRFSYSYIAYILPFFCYDTSNLFSI